MIRRLHSDLESTYRAHNSALRLAISNPLPEDVYFSKGSLAHRRYQRAAYDSELDAFGPAIAGKQPNIGEIPPERPAQLLDRDHWANADLARGERSLERCPDEEVFCLVRSKSEEKWGFPEWKMRHNEGLHSTVIDNLTGVNGVMDGKTMDTWLITKKPIGFVRRDQERVSLASLS